jgi:hypothetical protein
MIADMIDRNRATMRCAVKQARKEREGGKYRFACGLRERGEGAVVIWAVSLLEGSPSLIT